jgi:TonB family protein
MKSCEVGARACGDAAHCCALLAAVAAAVRRTPSRSRYRCRTRRPSSTRSPLGPGVEGETEVLVHVNEYGDVDSAFVSKTSGYAEFDSAAVAGARKLRFTPGRRGERRVAMWTRMPVRFARP